MAKNLYLLRHGTTGADGRLIGKTDLPISVKADDQLAKTADMVHQLSIQRCFTSPMLRCRQTVERLNLEPSPLVLEELREIDFGLWEGKNFPELERDFPDEVDEWSRQPDRFSFPGGESIAEFVGRVAKVREIVAQCDEQNILLISHGGVIRHLICSYLGLSSSASMLFNILPGCLSTVHIHSQGGVLTSLNSGVY